MTFRDYVFSSLMQKVSPESSMKYIVSAMGTDMHFSDSRISQIFWKWFFEVPRGVSESWISFLATNDIEGLEAMVDNFQVTVRIHFMNAIGTDASEIDESEDFERNLSRIYIEIFGDYLNNIIPNFVQTWNSFNERFEHDEGFEYDAEIEYAMI